MISRVILFGTLIFLFGNVSHAGVSSGGGFGNIASLMCEEQNPSNPIHPLYATLMSFGKPAFRHSLGVTVLGFPKEDYLAVDKHKLYEGPMNVSGMIFDCSARCRFFDRPEDQVTFDIIHIDGATKGILNSPGKAPIQFDCHS